MCRALKVLCAASGRDRMVELKKATVSTNWELVGGASSLAELVEQVESWRPDVVVIDEPLGAEAIQAVRSARERVRIVTVGAPVEDADENASSLEEIHAAEVAPRSHWAMPCQFGGERPASGCVRTTCGAAAPGAAMSGACSARFLASRRRSEARAFCAVIVTASARAEVSWGSGSVGPE